MRYFYFFVRNICIDSHIYFILLYTLFKRIHSRAHHVRFSFEYDSECQFSHFFIFLGRSVAASLLLLNFCSFCFGSSENFRYIHDFHFHQISKFCFYFFKQKIRIFFWECVLKYISHILNLLYTWRFVCILFVCVLLLLFDGIIITFS